MINDEKHGTEQVSNAQLASLEAKIAAVEYRLEQDEKSFVKRFGAWGGLVALLISIVAGSYSLYDGFWLRPKRELGDASRELRRAIGRISELNTRVVELQFEENTARATAIVMNINGEKRSLLSQADKLIKVEGAEADFADYIVLTWEHIQANNINKAVEYADCATEKAPSGGDLAEAHRYRGLALFLGEEPQQAEGRKAFSSALELAEELAPPFDIQISISALRDWIASEARIGECDKAQELYRRLGNILEERNASEGMIDAAEGMVDLIDKSIAYCDIMS